MKSFDRFPHSGVRKDLVQLKLGLSQNLNLTFGSSGEGELTIKARDLTIYARKYKRKDGWKIVVCQGAKEIETLFPVSNEDALSVVRSRLSEGVSRDETALYFKRACEEIEQAYESLGHSLGWRFLTGPSSTFVESQEILLLTLNPAGKHDYPEHPRESSESGSAYVVESWDDRPAGEATLQKQIRMLFAEMAERINGGSGDGLLAKSLSAHFVPFRSPSFDTLHEKERSIEFAKGLWSKILPYVRPRIIITLSREAFDALIEIESDMWSKEPDIDDLSIGWGSSYKATIARFSNGSVICRFPHLSRFAVFGRKESATQIADVMNLIAAHYKSSKTEMPKVERKMPGKTARGDKVIDRVLEAAQSLLQEKWLSKISIRRLCKEADVARASLFYQFERGWPDIVCVLEGVLFQRFDSILNERLDGKSHDDTTSCITRALMSFIDLAEGTGKLVPNIRSQMFVWGQKGNNFFHCPAQDYIQGLAEVLANGRDKVTDVHIYAAEFLVNFALDIAGGTGLYSWTAQERRELVRKNVEITVAGLSATASPDSAIEQPNLG